MRRILALAAVADGGPPGGVPRAVASARPAIFRISDLLGAIRTSARLGPFRRASGGPSGVGLGIALGPLVLMTLWTIVLPAQAVLTDVDPDGLLEDADPDALARLEKSTEDSFALVRDVLDVGGFVFRRSDAVALVLRAGLRRTFATGGARFDLRVDGRLVLRWGAFFAPSARVAIPGVERARRQRCASVERPSGTRSGRRAGHHALAARIRAQVRRHALAARHDALACARAAA